MSKEPSGLRCGLGYDTHRLVEGRELVLGGIEIPSPRGLLGHSDGDVLTHAIADALLGAAGLGDIGHYFPDSDPQWKDASSLKFLDTIRHLLAETGLRILNVDTTIVLDQPKLAPYIPQIKESLAAALAVEPAQVNIKAKTSEGLFPASFPMATAHAVALLTKA